MCTTAGRNFFDGLGYGAGIGIEQLGIGHRSRRRRFYRIHRIRIIYPLHRHDRNSKHYRRLSMIGGLIAEAMVPRENCAGKCRGYANARRTAVKSCLFSEIAFGYPFASRSRLEALLRLRLSSPFRYSRLLAASNLIGEHTDYNGGFVCPMAIEAAKPSSSPGGAWTRSCKCIRFPPEKPSNFSIDKVVPIVGPRWSLFGRGAVEAMRRKGKIQRGFDCIVDSTVPLGGGLSSSASFEVATALAALTVNQAAMDGVELAASHANGPSIITPDIPCGIMDPFSSG